MSIEHEEARTRCQGQPLLALRRLVRKAPSNGKQGFEDQGRNGLSRSGPLAVKHGPVQDRDVGVDMGKVEIKVVYRSSVIRHEFRGDTNPMAGANRDGGQIPVIVVILNCRLLASKRGLVPQIRRWQAGVSQHTQKMVAWAGVASYRFRFHSS